MRRYPSSSRSAVSGEVIARIGREIGIDHPLVIAKYGADLGRPRSFNDKVTRTGTLNLLALLVEQSWLHAEKREAGKTRFQHEHRAVA